MNWKSVIVGAPRESLDVLESFLWDQGAVSVTVTDAGNDPLFEPEPGEAPVWKRVMVTGLFEDDVDVQNIRDMLDFEGFGSVRIEDLGDRVWEREWLSRFKPMQFGESLWVCPGGYQVDAEGAVVIHLDPGLAFGTGTHPTTRLCLEWLDARSLAGKQLIDYGCGSGILGIAALLLGAREVIAIDNDSQALAASRENAERNGVADRIHTALPHDLSVENADIVLANILAEPLRELSETLISTLKVDGDMVLSGIMNSQKEWVVDAYERCILFEPESVLDEWICLHGKKVRPL